MAGARTSRTDPLRVDFLPNRSVNLQGNIGITTAPGQKDPHAAGGGIDRELDRDLRRLRRVYECDLLVTLLERGEFSVDEFALLQIPDLLARVVDHEMDSAWLPIADGGVPQTVDKLLAVVERIITAARQGKTAIIHGRDGLGRSGMVAAACLVALGASVTEALEEVRDLRPGSVASVAQEECLVAFDALWRERAFRVANPAAVTDLLSFQGDAAPVARISSPGVAPLSRGGAARVRYLGLSDGAKKSQVPGGVPVRDGDEFHLPPGTRLFVGRGAECDITMLSTHLSMVHAMMAFVPSVPERLVIADLGSRHGTWVDGESIEVRSIEAGCEFVLARAYRFVFEGVG